MAKIVSVTSCPTGIAHTFMAAEGVQRGAEALGHSSGPPLIRIWLAVCLFFCPLPDSFARFFRLI
mgnify:CR=1 FL=1